MIDQIRVGSVVYDFIPEICFPSDADIRLKMSGLEVALIPCFIGEVIPLSDSQCEDGVEYGINYHPVRKVDQPRTDGEVDSISPYVNTLFVASVHIPSILRREEKLRGGFLLEGKDKERLGLLVDLNSDGKTVSAKVV